ncbi:MAG: aminotransferase class I/II-fold pyridoxal phosphate-dependent enzyme [Deltaproteobacteria bacterium]|nr:aminotransferase class I/II-fold pyridoxal phosphate-dependent enzyme [Deltaproteobacteria bacterium]
MAGDIGKTGGTIPPAPPETGIPTEISPPPGNSGGVVDPGTDADSYTDGDKTARRRRLLTVMSRPPESREPDPTVTPPAVEITASPLNTDQITRVMKRLDMDKFPDPLDDRAIESRMDAIHEAMIVMGDLLGQTGPESAKRLDELLTAIFLNLARIINAAPQWTGIRIFARQLAEDVFNLFPRPDPKLREAISTMPTTVWDAEIPDLSAVRTGRLTEKGTRKETAEKIFYAGRGNPAAAREMVKALHRLISRESTRRSAILLVREFINLSAEFGADDAILVRDYSSVTGSAEPFYLLTTPTIFPPEKWTAAMINGLNKKDLTGKTGIEMGTGTGILPIYLAKNKGVKKIVSYDRNEDAQYVAEINAWLHSTNKEGNRLPGIQPVDMLEFATRDVGRGPLKGLKVDFIFGCLPQVPTRDRLTARNIADRYESQGFPEDKDGLGLLAEFLEKWNPALNKNGSFSLIVSGRPGLEAVEKMARRRGYVPFIGYTTFFAQDRWTDLSGYVEIEKSGVRPPFEFMLGDKVIDATEAHRVLAIFQARMGAAQSDEAHREIEADPAYDVLHRQYVVDFRPQENFHPAWEASAREARADYVSEHRRIGYTPDTGSEYEPFRKEMAAHLSTLFEANIPEEALFVGPSFEALLYNFFFVTVPFNGEDDYVPSEDEDDDQLQEPPLKIVTEEDPESTLTDQFEETPPSPPENAKTDFVGDNRDDEAITMIPRFMNSVIYVDPSLPFTGGFDEKMPRWTFVDDDPSDADCLVYALNNPKVSVEEMLAEADLKFVVLIADPRENSRLVELARLLQKNPEYRKSVAVVWQNSDLPAGRNPLAVMVILNDVTHEHMAMAGEDTYSRIPTLKAVSETALLKARREAGFEIDSGKMPLLPVEKIEDDDENQSIVTFRAWQLGDFLAHPPPLKEPGITPVIDMSFGESEFPLIEPFLSRVIAALSNKVDEEQVREQIRDYLSATGRGGFHPDEIVLGAGVHPLIERTLSIVGDDGPFRVMIPEGSYGQFFPTIHGTGGEDEIFIINPATTDTAALEAELEEALKSDDEIPVRAMILSYPTNPAGLFYSPEALRTIAEFCRKHDIYILADEIFLGTGQPADQTSLFNLPDQNGLKLFLREHLIGLSGLSKEFALGGARFGFAYTKNRRLWGQLVARELTPVNSTSLAIASVVYEKDFYEPYQRVHRAWLEDKRVQMVEFLKPYADAGLVSFREPQGGFFVEVDASSLFGRTFSINGHEWTIDEKGQNFREVLFEATGVKISPVGWSERPDTIRLVYSIENLGAALKRLGRFFESIRPPREPDSIPGKDNIARTEAMNITANDLRRQFSPEQLADVIRLGRAEEDRRFFAGRHTYGTQTFFARHHRLLELLDRRITASTIGRIAVFGAGFDRERAEIYEPYEVATVFRAARIDVFDGTEPLVETINARQPPPLTVEKDHFGAFPEFGDYLARFGTDQTVLEESGFKIRIPPETTGRVHAQPLQFFTMPVPVENEFDLIFALNIFSHLCLFHDGIQDDATIKLFLVQLFAALKRDGMVITDSLHDPASTDDNWTFQFPEEELRALGISVERIAIPVLNIESAEEEEPETAETQVVLFRKIGDGTPLLRELAASIKEKLRATSPFGSLRVIEGIPEELVGVDIHTALDWLEGPTAIHLDYGKPKTRVISVLMHGDEPSGFEAMLDYFNNPAVDPETNLVFLIQNVRAATVEPRFTHRFEPGTKDLNRQWFEVDDGEKIVDPYVRQVQRFLERFGESLEAIVDLHNDPAVSLPYAIVVEPDDALPRVVESRQLASYLAGETHYVDAMDRQGTFSLWTRQIAPSVTLEYGRPGDRAAHAFAARALRDFVSAPAGFLEEPDSPTVDPVEDKFRDEMSPDRIRAALSKVRRALILYQDFGVEMPSYTFFGMNRQVVAGLSDELYRKAINDMLVVGAGYNKEYPHTSEVYEWLTLLPQVRRLSVIDGNLQALEYLALKKNPDLKVEPDLYENDPGYRDYVNRFMPLHYNPASYLRDYKWYLPVDEGLPGKISTTALNFLTNPLPETKHDLIVCLNVLHLLAFFGGTDKTLARAFVVQLADALKTGGRLVLFTRSSDGEGIPFTEEEARVLGLERRVESFGTPFNTFIFAKIGDGTPLLRELATQIKAELGKNSSGGPKGPPVSGKTGSITKSNEKANPVVSGERVEGYGDPSSPPSITLDPDQLRKPLGGNQNRGVYRVTIDGIEDPLILKLHEQHPLLKEAKYAAWMSDEKIGPHLYGVYKIAQDGKILYGMLTEEIDGNPVKITGYFSPNAGLTQSDKQLFRTYWNERSADDWRRITRAFTMSTYQPRDYEILLSEDGRLTMIDAGSFSDLEGIPVNNRTRLSGLLSLESKLTDMLGFPPDSTDIVAVESDEVETDVVEDDTSKVERTKAEGEQTGGLATPSGLPNGGFGYLGRIPQGASPALSARALVLRGR